MQLYIHTRIVLESAFAGLFWTFITITTELLQFFIFKEIPAKVFVNNIRIRWFIHQLIQISVMEKVLLTLLL